METIFLAVVGCILWAMNREVKQDVKEAVADPQETPTRKTMAKGYGCAFHLSMLLLFAVVVAMVVTAGG